MPVWGEAQRSSPYPDVLDDYEPTGDFHVDYMAYVRLLGLMPHPEIIGCHTYCTVEEKHAAEEEVVAHLRKSKKNRDRKNRKKKGTTQHKNVCEVRIRGHKLDVGTVHAMCYSLAHAENVSCLHLWKVGIATRLLTELIGATASSSAVKALVVDWTPFPLPHAPFVSAESSILDWSGHVLAPLAVNSCSITTLSLRGSEFGDEEAKVLGELLSCNKSLKTLDLWDNRISNKGASSLAMALRTNSILQGLCLSKNKIGTEGALALAQTLSRYPLSYEQTRKLQVQRTALMRQRQALTEKTTKGRRAAPVEEEKEEAPKGRSGRRARHRERESKVSEPEPSAPAKKPDRAKSKQERLLEEIDAQLQILTPLEESPSVWVVAGNRTLQILQLAHNCIGKSGLDALTKMLEENDVIEHVSVHGNAEPPLIPVHGNVEVVSSSAQPLSHSGTYSREGSTVKNSETALVDT